MEVLSLPPAGTMGFDEDMTIAAWVKTTDANGQIVYYYSGVDDAGMSINISSGKASLTGRNDNFYSAVAIGTTDIHDDQWHYIVGTCDDGVWKIYVDGNLEDTHNGDPGTLSNLDEPFYIGGFIGNYLEGCTKEVSLWNIAKSGVEIDVEFNNYLGYSGSETNLKGYWKINDGTGETNLDDLSSENNDLTTQNSPTWESESLIVSYSPDVIQWSDYYPFGMQLPDRHFEPTNDYRHSFQGQEKDDEIKGEGNSVNYKFRMHDTRVGRFFAVDPMSGAYPWNSPYAFSENNVIACIDLEGLEKYWVIHWVDASGNVTATTIGDISQRSALQYAQYNGQGAIYFTLPDPGTQKARAKQSAQFFLTRTEADKKMANGGGVYKKDGLVDGEKEIHDKYHVNDTWKAEWDKGVVSYSDIQGPHVRTLTWDFPLTLNEKFDQNSSVLGTPTMDLQVLGQTMYLLNNSTIVLHGYTNSDGSDAENLQLSLDRANAIRDYLITVWGIDGSRITVEGHGETELILNSDGTENKEGSRRVEVEVINSGITSTP